MQRRVKHTFVSSVVACVTLATLLPGCGAAGEAPGEELGSLQQELGACASQALTVAAATASSEQNNGYFAATKAIDGNASTRWSSEPTQSAPQWLRLDLGSRKLISSLSIDWETAYSPSYEIQASDNGTNWAVVRKVTNTQSGVQTVSQLDVTARYVRVYAKTMSGYGNVSIRDLTVYGDSNSACTGTSTSCGGSVRLNPTQTTATSSEFSYTPASSATDGVYSTRWSSQWSDDQALTLDLGAMSRVDGVRITWESAYAAKYAIESAPSITGPWTQVAVNNAGQGGVESLSLGGISTRYLRFHGIQRATGYGYSIWELDVFGSSEVCGTNLLTNGWDPAACTNNIGVAQGQASVAGLYSIDPGVLNRIDFSQMGTQYCPQGFPPFLNFTQHVTVPASGSTYHLTLDIPRNDGTIAVVVTGATLGGVAGSNISPNPDYNYSGGPVAQVSGAGRVDMDFVTNLTAGQNVDLSVRFQLIGVALPGTNCGASLQSYTLQGASLTRTN